jgi:putative spermidine/putrescine transport system ATP-binding protein
MNAPMTAHDTLREGRGEKIVLDNLVKRYGEVLALDNVSLSVRPGEFLTLLGPSGSGKTTLLNMICGAVLPTEGRLLIDGTDFTYAAVRDRSLGMVFQNYALLPHMTVFDNVAFPLRIRKRDRAEIDRAVHSVLERVGLSGLAQRKPRELSGGQQQRVGIARCLVYSPSIILMDEPLGALDKKLREQLQEEIKRLHVELSTTIIYVTHDQEEALNLSDRICLMDRGRIEQLGTPEELYFEPRTVFTADFVGESNLFKGTLVDTGTFRTKTGRPVKIADARGVTSQREATLLVRPEKITTHGIDGEPNRATCIVETVSFVGGSTRITARSEDGMQFLLKAVSSRSESQIQVGANIDISWSAADSIVLAE